MGNNLFNANISGLLAKHLGPKLAQMYLIKVVPGTRDTTDPSAGLPLTRRTVPCKGILEDFKLSQIDGTIIQKGDRMALILGDTLPKGIVPEANDEFKAEGKVHTVVGIPTRDPDAASYILQLR